jgi:hypothetical protein
MNHLSQDKKHDTHKSSNTRNHRHFEKNNANASQNKTNGNQGEKRKDETSRPNKQEDNSSQHTSQLSETAGKHTPGNDEIESVGQGGRETQQRTSHDDNRELEQAARQNTRRPEGESETASKAEETRKQHYPQRDPDMLSKKGEKENSFPTTEHSNKEKETEKGKDDRKK